MSSSPGFVPFAVPDITESEVEAAANAIRSGWLTTGQNAAAFEKEFAQFLGGGMEAVAVNSATAGLHLALEAAGIEPGDEVIVPTWTFTASAEVVRYLGAEPVLVDVAPDTLNIDLAAAEAAVTPRTRAIIPVHFAGLPVDGEQLARFARRHNLIVVEDAAHAFPAATSGRMVGAGSSDATVFSFYATKTMTTGEGGMLVTSRADIADRARTMRLHGISRDVFDRYTSTKPSWFYEVVAPGYKYNLTDPAAAIGRVQLSRARDMADRRAALAAHYDRELSGLPLELPTHAMDGEEHAWHLYVVRIDDALALTRDSFVAQMAERGVGTSVHFIPLHLHPYWRDRSGLRPEDLPVASREFSRAVSLPLFSSMSAEQQSAVVDAVKAVVS